jgi:ubiquinone/menaquinone biosynthesis C-methylase UbiE
VSFDRLAPVYRALERVLAGDKLQRCRLAHLPKTRDARKALLLGEGHGRFIIPLLQANPAVQITCIDASAAMLAQTKRAMTHAGLDPARVEFVCTDIFDWHPAAHGFDLVSTNFFLDCFRTDQLAMLVPRLASLVTPDARWMIADFCSPAHGLAKLRAQAILWSMYRFFRVVTRLPATQLADYTGPLQQQGFKLTARETFDWGLLRADCWQRR